MDESYYTSQRRELKHSLFLKRSDTWTTYGYKPACAICGKPFISSMPAMHESLISRGDVRGNLNLKHKIMVAYNCVLVHNEGCHEIAETEVGKEACAKYLLKYENINDILNWLTEMQGLMRGTIPDEAIRLIKEVQ